MDDETKTALETLRKDFGADIQGARDALFQANETARVTSDRLAKLEAVARDDGDLNARLSALEAHATNPATPSSLVVTGEGIYAGLDALAHRTLAEARAVLDEYYPTYLAKVRKELGLPDPVPVPVLAVPVPGA